MTGLVAAKLVDENEQPGVERIESTDVLAPGYYWRVKQDFAGGEHDKIGRSTTFHAGDCHLLLDVFEFEGRVHSVEVLAHPRTGCSDSYKLMLDEFVANMEPAYDADQDREREQAEILARVQEMQDEVARGQNNPLILPGVQEAAEAAVQKFEREMVAEAQAAEKSSEQREKDLRRIHRRAARRSAAAGNPLVPRTLTISNDLSEMINSGVNSEGLKELSMEARRRAAIAEASSKWLAARVGEIGATMQRLAPFYAEKGRVAVARSKKAISYAKSIMSGLASLKLYTGDSVEVVTVVEGKSASTSQPLTIAQAKRFMNEELAVHADVNESFDWTSQQLFFDALVKSEELRDQIFPAERCVITMAVRRSDLEYEARSAMEAVMNNLLNRRVFLLVRDGENVHAVYSMEPSHEAAARLFPTRSDIEAPFVGLDGSKIRMDEVAFIGAAEAFADEALHYKRFLILLCGLDHRLKLLGDFYPQERAAEFMSLEFQERYFRFLEDDDPAAALPADLPPVRDFVAAENLKVISGSRVVVTAGAREHSPEIVRRYGVEIDFERMPRALIVSRERERHYVTLPWYKRHDWMSVGSARAWLDDKKGESGDWYICIDHVSPDLLRRYVYNRASRATSITWLRTFKRAIAAIEADRGEQAELRAYLRREAITHADIDPGCVDALMDTAIATWRAAHRGAPAPAATEHKAANEILTMMFPAERIADAIDQRLAQTIREHGWTPLLLARTGKTKLVLYVEASDADKAPYAQPCEWGWVKRVVLEPRRTKIAVGAISLVWLNKSRPNPAEEVFRTWSASERWIHDVDEPATLKALAEARRQIDAGQELAGLLAGGRSGPSQAGIPGALFERICTEATAAVKPIRYFSHPAFYFLVGVYQERSSQKIRFLYAATEAGAFVRHYGTRAQLEEYAGSLHGFRKCAMEQCLSASQKWNLAESDTLMSGVVRVHPYNSMDVPRWATVGLIEQRAKGWPHGSRARASVRLSWNRAVEALVGYSARQRRDFYADIAERIRSEKRFPDFVGERSQRIQKLANAKFASVASGYHVSTLLWEPGASRSHANRFFSMALDVKK